MADSIFDKSRAQRAKDQEAKKQDIGLEAKDAPERINLSLPASCKNKFINYCQAHYISPSAQLRAWIDQNCND